MFYIGFNNKTTKDLGISVVKRPNIPIPERNVISKDIPGRNGSVTIDYKTYKDIIISVSLNFISKENFNAKVLNISEWLLDIKDNKLIFSDNPDFYYKVKKIEFKNIERSLKKLGRFTVSFVCDPFKYCCDNNEIDITKTVDIISPAFVYESNPIITIFGNGNLEITINNKKIQLENVEEYITIDSELKECYKNSSNLNYKMIGEFPKFIRGKNNIDLGNSNKIKIQQNWRYL